MRKLNLGVASLKGILSFVVLAATLLSHESGASLAGGEAERLMDQVQKKLSTLFALRADFVQKFTQGKDQQVESGVLWLSRGEKMRWNYHRPQEKLFLVDGKHQYTWIPSENRVFRESLKATEDRRTPLLLLLGKLHWKKIFSKVEPMGRLGAGASEIIQVRAAPKEESSGYQSVELSVEKNTLHLVRIRIDNMDRSIMEFSFANIQENPRIDPRQFSFRIPPGAEVIEQKQ